MRNPLGVLAARCLAVVMTSGALVLTGCGPTGSEDESQDSTPGTGGTGSSDTSGGTGGGNGEGSPSGRSLFFTAVQSLVGVDTGSHAETLDVTYTEGSSEADDIALTADQVWLAREDGVVVAVDREGEAVAAELDMQPLDTESDDPVEVSHVAVGDAFAYTTVHGFGLRAAVAIDRTTFESTVNTESLTTGVYTSGILHDGSHVWIATGAASHLYKLDPITLDAVGEVDFSELFRELPRAPVSWGGDQLIAHLGDSIWVVDNERVRLLKVRRDSLAVTVVDDLADVSHVDESFAFAENGRDLYLMLANQDVVLRFDGATGQRTMRYEFADRGGVVGMAVNDRNLYIRCDDTFPAIFLEVDLESGETLREIRTGTASSHPLAVD